MAFPDRRSDTHCGWHAGRLLRLGIHATVYKTVVVCSGIELVPVAPGHPRVESRLKFLAHIGARRFALRAAPGNPGQNPRCARREPLRYVALSRLRAPPKRRSARSRFSAESIVHGFDHSDDGPNKKLRVTHPA